MAQFYLASRVHYLLNITSFENVQGSCYSLFAVAPCGRREMADKNPEDQPEDPDMEEAAREVVAERKPPQKPKPQNDFA